MPGDFLRRAVRVTCNVATLGLLAVWFFTMSKIQNYVGRF